MSPFHVRRIQLLALALAGGVFCLVGGHAKAEEVRGLAAIQQALVAKKGSVPRAEMVAALRGEKSERISPAFVFVFGKACENADAKTLGELTEIFAESPGGYWGGEIFEELADAWVRVKVPEKLSQRLVFPDPAKPPVFPESFPKKYRAAAETYLRVTEPFQKLMQESPEKGGKIDFQTHETQYWKLTEKLLKGEGGPFTEKFLAYRWGGWCGTGSERFRAPHSRALFMALVADKRWTEAVGAVFSRRTKPGESELQLLRTGVGDPLMLLGGGLAYLGTSRIETGNGTDVLLSLLQELPGDERVDMLGELIGVAAPGQLKLYFRALGKFLPSSTLPKEDGKTRVFWGRGSSGDMLGEVRPAPVSPDAQKRALNILTQSVSNDLPIEAAEELALVFRERLRPEALPALRKLLDHPSQKVAEEAAETLRYAGEEAEAPAKLGPVRYRILVDGKPYSSRKVSWTLGRGPGGGIGSEVTTGEDGVAEISRDYFIDKRHSPVERVALRSTEMRSLEDPWFGVILPPPPVSDEIQPVNIETKALRVELTLPRSPAETGDREMEVTLWGAQSAEQAEIGFWSPAKMKIPMAGVIEFKSLMPETYRLELRIPGAESWTGAVASGKQGTMALKPARASDVRLRVKPPEGWHATAFIPEMRQDGKRVSCDWDYENRMFHGVREGSYVLHMPSRTEVKKRMMGVFPDGPDFDGVDVPFVIGPDSPPEIDLGEIAVKVKTE